MELPGLDRISTALKTQRAARSFGMESLERLLAGYLPPEQVSDVHRAAEFAEHAHRRQFRKSGEPYVFHPLAVARILAEMRLDSTTIMAAILHDVIEDTPTAAHDLEGRFGKEVARLVEGVSKVSRAENQSREEAHAATVNKLLLAMVQDARVILIKLADRLHNLRTLGAMKPSSRRRIARETLDLYAPMAHRLGLHAVRVELEDLAFAYLHPHRHQVLRKAVAARVGGRRDIVAQVIEQLQAALTAEGLQAEVSGREKNLYSIYTKMRKRHSRFLDVLDVYGFRVVGDSVDACYRALGIVHHVYRPICNQFNDFIAIPKTNGYQSLHTSLYGPSRIKIEVQIRTQEMHRLAEHGIAAHWAYKLGEGASTQLQPTRDWLKSLLESGQQADSPEEFLEHVKVELFPDEVFVFTPKGAAIRLPRGATAVDFAYAIHTDLGNRCVAARVDENLMSLSTPLQNGQRVEIMTARRAMPNPAWLNFVRTLKARHAIRHYLKHQKVEQAETLGRRMLRKALREVGVSVRSLNRQQVQRALDSMALDSLATLHRQIGLGERLAPLAARHFLSDADKAGAKRHLSMAVEGTEGLVVEYAKCCLPIPGDPIVGHVSSGRGVVIHRVGCKLTNSKHLRGQDWVDLRWSRRIHGDFHVDIRIECRSQRGILAMVTTQLAEAGSSIDKVALPERIEEVAVMRFNITVTDRVHLARVLRRLRNLPPILRVARL